MLGFRLKERFAKAMNAPGDKSYREGKYDIEKKGDVTSLFHYGTLIYAYDKRYQTPVRQEGYGGYSVSDQSAIKQAIGAAPNPRGAYPTRRNGPLRLVFRP